MHHALVHLQNMVIAIRTRLVGEIRRASGGDSGEVRLIDVTDVAHPDVQAR